MKIAANTTIKRWLITEGKEILEFENLDFSPNQVSELDRIITNTEDGDKLFLEFEPVQKKLQINPISSAIKITGLDCRKKGKKLILTGFHSPDDRAVVMKRLTDTKTPIRVTINDTQPALFEEHTEKNAEPESEPQTNDNGIFEKTSKLVIKLPKSYKAKISISWVKLKGKFYTGYEIDIPNTGVGKPVSINNLGKAKIAEALDDAQEQISDWLEKQKHFKYTKQVQTKITKTIKDYIEKYEL